MENHEPTLVEGDETKALFRLAVKRIDRFSPVEAARGRAMESQMLLGRFEHGDHVHLPAVRGLALGVQNGPASSTAL